MKKIMFLLTFMLGLFVSAEAQKVTKEIKSDTIEVSRIFIVDSATNNLKAVSIPFIVRKVEVNTVQLDGTAVPPWGMVIGLFDPKNKLIKPVMVETKDGRVNFL